MLESPGASFTLNEARPGNTSNAMPTYSLDILQTNKRQGIAATESWFLDISPPVWTGRECSSVNLA